MYRQVFQVPQILHFEPSLGALSLRSDVISSIKIISGHHTSLSGLRREDVAESGYEPLGLAMSRYGRTADIYSYIYTNTCIYIYVYICIYMRQRVSSSSLHPSGLRREDVAESKRLSATLFVGER